MINVQPMLNALVYLQFSTKQTNRILIKMIRRDDVSNKKKKKKNTGVGNIHGLLICNHLKY